MTSQLDFSVHIEEWPAREPFRIAGLVRENFRLIVVEISDGRYVGRGEGSPVLYLGETAESIYAQVVEVADLLRQGLTRDRLSQLMGSGGARCAIDTALWDLEAKRSRRGIWGMTGLSPQALPTTTTIGIAEDPADMARIAKAYQSFHRLKVKVGADKPVERVAAVRAARPDAMIVVDANQSWDPDLLRFAAPKLVELGVVLLEQPLPRGKDEALQDFDTPLPICADESCQNRCELDVIAARYQIINIKLAKAGGLTEAFHLLHAVKSKGLKALLSTMCGTSLGMAPGFVVGQLADYVELDGPLLLRGDRVFGLNYSNGMIGVPAKELWG